MMNRSHKRRGVVRALYTLWSLTLAVSLLLTGSVSASKSLIELKTDDTPVDREGLPPRSYAPMIEKATPAVVAVYTAEIIQVVRSRGMSPEEEFFHRFFGVPAPRRRPLTEEDIEERKMPQGVGSGVIITKDGYILTNNHVVMDPSGNDADEVLVQLADGRELSAEIVGRDPQTDIAVIKVDAEDLPVAHITDSEAVKVGDIVFAIGNPLNVGTTVSKGIVSALGRSIGIYGVRGYENFIQTDAAINRGNSGGALIDIDGRLIGINSAILSGTGGNIGIGFAIPSNLALAIARQLVNSGEVRRGYLGVSINDLSAEMAEAFGLDNTDGALINEVEDGTPADEAGIKRGDIIVAIEDRPVRSANELRLRIAETPPGATVRVKLLRSGKERSLEVTLADLEGELGLNLIEGIEVRTVAEQDREPYAIPDDVSGVLITAVDPVSPHARRLAEGMVIIEINDRAVETVQDVRDALHKGVNKLYIYHRGRVGYLAIRVR